MQVDCGNKLADVIHGLNKFAHRTYVEGDTIVATDAANAAGVVITLPFDMPGDEMYRINHEKFGSALNAIDEDFDLSQGDDGAYLLLDDGTTQIKVRKYEARSGINVDPRDANIDAFDTKLDIELDEIVKTASKSNTITETDEVTLDADGTDLKIYSSSKINSYETTLELGSQALPAKAMFAVDYLKKINKIAPKGSDISMGEDKPIVTEGKHGDINVLTVLTPRIEE